MKPIYILGDNHGDNEGMISTLKERNIRRNHSAPAFFDLRVMLPKFKLLRDYTMLHLYRQS